MDKTLTKAAAYTQFGVMMQTTGEGRETGNGNVNVRKAPRHPIGVVASRTGLTPDVLRVWERRYGIVEPTRTESGQRLYSDADVERLRLLQQATAEGRSISHLADLSTAELQALVDADSAAAAPPVEPVGAPADADAWIALALERTTRLDAPGLEQLLRRLAAVWGTSVFLESLAAPLFRRIGEEWHQGRLKPAHEHLATAVMRGVLTSLSSELAPPTSAPRLVVATPVGERHEIGALLVAAAAAAAGWRLTYLGAELPAAEIAAAADQCGARAVAVSVVLPGADVDVVAELRELRLLLPSHVDLLVGGGGATELRDILQAPGIVWPGGLPELRTWLRRQL
jgi:MerR family transcriptional regulator, light-induced transcriptional regulator